MKKFLLFIILFFLAFAYSCKDDTILPPIDIGLNYYPAAIGNYIVYDVDSIFYDKFFNKVDTFYYQIKEVFESEFIDNEGRKSFRIERYYRHSDTMSWQIDQIQYATKTDLRVEKVEDNVRYIKLAFPVDLSNTWNGNAMNSQKELEYYYEDIDKSFQIKNVNFDSTLVVIHIDEPTLVSDDYESEIFARHIGLIYRKYSHLDKSPTTGQIVSGYTTTYQIVENGVQ